MFDVEIYQKFCEFDEVKMFICIIIIILIIIFGDIINILKFIYDFYIRNRMFVDIFLDQYMLIKI